MPENMTSPFVVDLLLTLRQDRFRARAWGIFLWRSWLMACQTATENSTLKRSWLRTTAFITFLALAILIANSLCIGLPDTLRLLPGLIFCVVWQQCDLFWHLGLNRSIHNNTLFPTLGIANNLTWLRGLAASYLVGRLIGGLVVTSGLALAIFLFAIATDILDGSIARRTKTQSRLGQIADAETDFCLSLSLIIIFLQNGILPLWVGIVMLLRFLLPLVAALLSYLAFAHPLRFGSTWPGKYAGLAQCLYFLVLLAPPSLVTFTSILGTPLLCITICLLIAAPIAQVVVNMQAHTTTTNTITHPE
ncbi:hypothetical protein KDA_56750 [Dictyobacter alpinus]|uniref:CDP-alcohol phosphatidyltransferase n=1 Tax=Dictyobacter alpinus TaxID=2014873 RepID=A0A402BFJ5_9CHLR|nr:CDP-alcohol phosphatidyltransferase family protein [Dictyobacter alpinus]GCE30191.1 hypothetical protein KDA_56750 [Dictyobacter alpinus]